MKCHDLVGENHGGGRADSSDMQLYQEALSCMELIASQLESDTDYPMVLHLYQQCSGAIASLRSSTHYNPHISASLEDLLETLSFQKSVLDKRNNNNSSNSFSTRLRGTSDGTLKYNARKLRDKTTAPGSGVCVSSLGGAGSSTSSHSIDTIHDMLVPYTGQTTQIQEVVGLEEVKEVLREAVVMPLEYPQLFKGGAKPWRRLLLYGPPGTGKTKLARALASELQCAFYCVSSANLLSPWVGESEKLIKELFQHARQQANRTFIFIDEIDCLCRKRSHEEDEHSRRVKSELLRQLEGAGMEDVCSSTGDEGTVFVLGATNCPWDLDSAFLRRFQRRLYVPLPSSEDRRAIISAQFSSHSPLHLNDTEWEILTMATRGYSGADLTHLATAAAFRPIRDLQTARFWKFMDDNKITPCPSDTLGAMQYPLSKLPADKVVAREVELGDLMAALATTPRTVTPEEVQRYQTFSGNTSTTSVAHL